ncbi:Hypothetical protein AA314_04727 [Archangium gephyra]|uniref:Uncharacterized protein n=1 Tax=Archangium gephyra TaxID=48 RepID=A0AAC8Q8W4_9BACT|nr:Hypothetical protein AA314_04727 [Archangium gephyra]
MRQASIELFLTHCCSSQTGFRPNREKVLRRAPNLQKRQSKSPAPLSRGRMHQRFSTSLGAGA